MSEARTTPSALLRCDGDGDAKSGDADSRDAEGGDALAEERAQKERLAALGTMCSVLAHEIRNPLASLKGNAQLVVEGLPAGTKLREQADRVVEAAVRLQALCDNLLDFVREGPIERASADPAELLCLAAEDAAPSAILDIDRAPDAWSLDAERMRQVLGNLLQNAAHAAPDRPILASAFEEDDKLVFTVKDEGGGLPPGDPALIFDPFYTTKTRGVGLGLAVARRVVELHGGEITARNRPAGGAELRVAIPRPRGVR
jgi:two-component system sensor histidine kinase HydH